MYKLHKNLFIPFFLIKTGHFFNIVRESIAYRDIALAYQNTLRITNIELLFLFLTVISFILYLFIKIFIMSLLF